MRQEVDSEGRHLGPAIRFQPGKHRSFNFPSPSPSSLSLPLLFLPFLFTFVIIIIICFCCVKVKKCSGFNVFVFFRLFSYIVYLVCFDNGNLSKTYKHLTQRNFSFNSQNQTEKKNIYIYTTIQVSIFSLSLNIELGKKVVIMKETAINDNNNIFTALCCRMFIKFL